MHKQLLIIATIFTNQISLSSEGRELAVILPTLPARIYNYLGKFPQKICFKPMPTAGFLILADHSSIITNSYSNHLPTKITNSCSCHLPTDYYNKRIELRNAPCTNVVSGDDSIVTKLKEVCSIIRDSYYLCYEPDQSLKYKQINQYQALNLCPDNKRVFTELLELTGYDFSSMSLYQRICFVEDIVYQNGKFTDTNALEKSDDTILKLFSQKLNAQRASHNRS